jgi:hypothetical protein
MTVKSRVTRGMASLKSEYYRREAEKIRASVQRITDAAMRRQLSHIAALYEKLAGKAEKLESQKAHKPK